VAASSEAWGWIFSGSAIPKAFGFEAATHNFNSRDNRKIKEWKLASSITEGPVTTAVSDSRKKQPIKCVKSKDL